MTKLALVFSGGASLGSYAGGAATEILRALEEGRGRSDLELAVVTGSSSGALNAALASRTVAVNPNLRPWIRRAWVDGADADSLLSADRRDRRGLLDVSVLDDLASALVAGEPAADDRPGRAMGRRLRVGITLANLDGVPYRNRYGFLNLRDRFYGTRVHRDWMEFEIDRDRGAGHPMWEELRDAAVASASFPLAFPPRRLIRDRDEYPGALLEDPEDDGVEMWYADGGLMDNRPLGLAKDLVELDPDHRDHDWKYVLVDPHLEDEGATERIRPRELDSPARVAGRVVEALMGQGAARDWATAQKTNTRLEILERISGHLPRLASRLDDPDAVGLGRDIGRLAEEVAELKVAVSRRRDADSDAGDPVLDYLEENLARIESDPRYRDALEATETRAGGTRLAKTIFLLESAAGLRDKDLMDLYLVAPPRDQQLAGAFLGNFGGFFHRAWRLDDFRAGRRDARRLFTGPLGDLVDYEPAREDAYSPRGYRPSLEDLDADARSALRSFLATEVDGVLDQVRPGGLASLFTWAWKPALRRWAVDRAMERLKAMG